MEIRVSLVEDHLNYRNHIKQLLLNEGSFAIHKEYENGGEIVKDIDSIKNEIILMDLKMPVMDGFDATKIILTRKPDAIIIILTLFDESEFILSLNRLGIRGFLSKTIEPNALFSAIKSVQGGGFCYSGEAGKILQKNLTLESNRSSIMLSETEKIMLQFICDGRSSSEIAQQVHKSSRTVEDHRQKLYQKFNVENKEQLIVKCVKLKLI